MPATPFILLLAAMATATAAPGPSPDRPLLAARNDGSWLVTEAIHEAPPPLASVTGGLLIDEEPPAEAREDYEAVAEAEEEAAAQRAFEEAIDAARREPRL
jgi:hypothetical protein